MAGKVTARPVGQRFNIYRFKLLKVRIENLKDWDMDSSETGHCRGGSRFFPSSVLPGVRRKARFSAQPEYRRFAVQHGTGRVVGASGQHSGNGTVIVLIMYRIDLDQLLVWFIDMPLLAEACSQSLDRLFCIICFCLTDKQRLAKIENLFRFPRELIAGSYWILSSVGFGFSVNAGLVVIKKRLI